MIFFLNLATTMIRYRLSKEINPVFNFVFFFVNLGNISKLKPLKYARTNFFI